ncbi:MAG: hypothetical protein Q9196_001744 [Gyalolechia fulgens]
MSNSPTHSYERSGPAEAPTSQSLPSARIFIRHPGYPEQCNVLMRFLGYDRLGQKEGIHYGTILAACSIVSGRDDGFLTLERGNAPLGLELDDLLGEGSYYFIVPDDDQYAIYPSFQHWKFPHGRLPRGWSFSQRTLPTPSPAPAQSNISNAVLARDQGCLVSGHKDILEQAHLCPQKESTWFRNNNMSVYNLSYLLSPDCTVDDMSNLIALREDIHTAFDRQRMFAVVVKQGKWMIHFLQPSHHLGPLYHNVKARLNDEVAPEHVLARFAWAIFPLVRLFLHQGPRRSIRALVTDQNGYPVEENAIMDVAAISDRFFPPRTRSQSPKKRARTDDEVPDEFQEREAVGTWDKRATNACGLHVKGASGVPKSRIDETSLPTLQHFGTSTTAATPDRGPTVPPTEDVQLQFDYDGDGIDDPDPRVHRLYLGESRLDRLRRLELKRRRPYHNPNLFCCDYDRKTAAVHAAIKGEGDWDEYQLCGECLGGEYLPRAGELDD